MGGFSIWHLLLVTVVFMLLFGAGKVSDLGKGLGEGIRNFKKGIKDEDDEPRARRPPDDEEEVEVQVGKVKKQLPPASDVPKKKKVIQIEVDEDADEDEVARQIVAKKKSIAAASEDEKAT